VADALRNGGTVIVEGGHNSSPDCGAGFLEGLLDVPGIDPRHPEVFADALTRAQSLVAEAGVDLVCAASTARPLLGLDSVLAVAPGPHVAGTLGSRTGLQRDLDQTR